MQALELKRHLRIILDNFESKWKWTQKKNNEAETNVIEENGRLQYLRWFR
jgi:hypothetical protein